MVGFIIAIIIILILIIIFSGAADQIYQLQPGTYTTRDGIRFDVTSSIRNVYLDDRRVQTRLEHEYGNTYRYDERPGVKHRVYILSPTSFRYKHPYHHSVVFNLIN